MKEIFIIENDFEENRLIFEFLIKKNINSEILNLEKIKGQQKNKSTILCSKALQDKLGGKSELLKLSRSFGSTNVVVLDKTDSDYNITAELGGAYLVISYKDLTR